MSKKKIIGFRMFLDQLGLKLKAYKVFLEECLKDVNKSITWNWDTKRIPIPKLDKKLTDEEREYIRLRFAENVLIRNEGEITVGYFVLYPYKMKSSIEGELEDVKEQIQRFEWLLGKIDEKFK